jgi:hypothetical protein
VRDVPEEGGPDGVPLPLRRHVLRAAPVHGRAQLRVRLQGPSPGDDRQAESGRGGPQARQDLKQAPLLIILSLELECKISNFSL